MVAEVEVLDGDVLDQDAAPQSGTSPKNARKPQQRTLSLRAAISTIVAEYDMALTIRQLYYQLVSRKAIEKTEAAYKKVSRVACDMRDDGTLDYEKIIDGNRQRNTPFVHDDLHHALHTAHALYRRDYWRDQPRHVEVWCEKEALSGVLRPVCDRYRVPYVATRGFPSRTILYQSAQAMINTQKPTYLFYFGDHDPSGRCISDDLEQHLRRFGAKVTVERMALNLDQISRYGLPTRPSKRTDSREAAFFEKYGDDCVELDALPPDVLTDLAAECIETWIDDEAWDAAVQIEEQEIRTFQSLAEASWTPGVRYLVAGDQDEE